MKTSLTINYYCSPRDSDEKQWSHKYDEEWERTDLYCPNCGTEKVWHETGDGDYYVGETYLCTHCEHRFYLPAGTRIADDEQDKQRLKEIRDYLPA